jgi:hypothetical protein
VTKDLKSSGMEVSIRTILTCQVKPKKPFNQIKIIPMKKLFYSLALLLVLAVATISCTKEEIKPQGGGNNGGVQTSDKGF